MPPTPEAQPAPPTAMSRLDTFTLGILQSVVGQKGANISDSGIRIIVRTAQRALAILEDV